MLGADGRELLGEEHVEAELGDGLGLALGGRVPDGDIRIVDEAEQRGAVAQVVADGRRQGARRRLASAMVGA